MSDIRNNILNKYYEYRSNSADPQNEKNSIRHYENVVKHNYIPYIQESHKKVLEIGCYTGYTLLALKKLMNFQTIEGLEISDSAANIARDKTKISEIYTEDAFKFLPEHKNEYDVIIMKAVLEHIRKEETGLLLQSIYDSLKPGGVTLISAPNMDWISATHERYMDFTHETGYTAESLQDIMCMYFDKMLVRTLKYDFIYGIGSFIRIAIFQPVIKCFIKRIYKILGQGAYRKNMFDRSILGVGWKSEK